MYPLKHSGSFQDGKNIFPQKLNKPTTTRRRRCAVPLRTEVVAVHIIYVLRIKFGTRVDCDKLSIL